MIHSATITQKGQVTIPASIRKLLNLEPYGKVSFEVKDQQVLLKPAVDLLSLKGSLRSKNPRKKPFPSNQDMDKAVLDYFKTEYEKENR